MSDDIRPGDVVVCVDDRTSRGSPVVHAVRGRSYRVTGVIYESSYHDLFGTDGGGLWLCGIDRALAARRFRKIPKADESFTARIRACRPIKTKEPV